MATAFSRQLGWNNMELLISQFQDRLNFGIHSDLLELMKLSSLNGMRARTLFNAGFETISSIALADVNVIETILLKAVPFETEKEKVGDDLDDFRKRKKIKNIWITGRCGLTARDAAFNLITEARKYLEQEIGGGEIKWSINVENNENNLENSGGEILKLIEHDVDCEVEKLIDININNKSDMSVKSSIQTENFSENANEIVMKSIKQMEKCSQNSTKVEMQSCNQMVKPNKVDDVNDYCKLSAQNEIIHNSDRHENEKCKSVNVKIDVCNGMSVLENTSNTSKSKIYLPIKDETVWESLNLTEGAIENISKVQNLGKMFSPNISFGETENENLNTSNHTEKVTSSKCTSDRDLSLFSFDSDDSSLFEDSLTLDSNSNKLFDNKNTMDTSLDYPKIDSNKQNTIKSTIPDKDDEEEFKLVYEDDKSQINIEAGNIQEAINETIKGNELYFSSKRRSPEEKCSFQPEVKKKKVDNEVKPINRIQNCLQVFPLTINNENSQIFILEIGQYKLTCHLLKGSDIIDNIPVIKNIHNVSIYLNTRNLITAPNEAIGSNIFRVPKSPKVGTNCSPIKGIAVYFGDMKCIYLDYCSLDSHYSIVKDTMATWFISESLRLKLLSLKIVNFYIKRWLDIDMRTSCVDISLLEWLADSDEKIPNISYLVSTFEFNV